MGETDKALAEINKILENPSLDVELKTQALYAKASIIADSAYDAYSADKSIKDALSIAKELKAWSPTSKLTSKLALALQYKYIFIKKDNWADYGSMGDSVVFPDFNFKEYSRSGKCLEDFIYVDEKGTKINFIIKYPGREQKTGSLCINDNCVPVGEYGRNAINGRFTAIKISSRAPQCNLLIKRNDL